jgi:hypothetical protein
MAFPETANLTLSRGADFNFTLRLLDALGDPVPLTGGSTAFKAEIREAFKKPKAAAFTITAQTGDDSGDLLFELSNDATLLLDPRRTYQWDFFWTDTTGIVYHVLAGAATVKPNITHL